MPSRVVQSKICLTTKHRQLRPHIVSGAFLPDKGAWLWEWRLCKWRRRCSEKNNSLTPMERLCKLRQPGRAKLNSLWKDKHET